MITPLFIHLRVHTAFSLSEGAIRLGDLTALCQKYRMPAVGICDSNNLFAALEFSKLCSSNGIQPIIGTVLNIKAENTEKGVRENTKNNPYKLPVFVQNERGYSNLLKLVGMSYLETDEHEAPILDLDDIKKSSKGLIALSGGVEGPIGRYLQEGNTARAEHMLETLKTIFPGRLYMEIQRHDQENEKNTEPAFLDLAYAHNIPLVATNDAYFPERKMHEAHDALLCIADGRYVMEDNRRRLTPEHYFKSAREMQTLFADLPEAIANTVVIAKRCAYMSPARDPLLPTFSTEKGRNEEDEFRKIASDGLEWRLENYVFTKNMDEEEKQKMAQPYWERLEFELDTIIHMKFPGYFLIVSDFIRWSKKHGIPVGPGRGSGAGSLVAWSMRITDLDPLRFGLLFERFLNPERVSMPDFDVDFCQERRDEVIRYVQDKYGSDRVAQIITFGKLQARAVLRDVGRVLHMPYPQVDKICKLVPNNPANPVTLSEAISMEPMLKAAIKEDEQVEKMVDIALKLEGLNRHASTHAAGVVIADRPLNQLVPMYRDPRSDMPVVQFSMKYAEMAGLVKFDFLGLKTLTVLSHACALIKEQGINLDLLKLPFNDQKTYDMLGRGESIGVFQLESAGMRDTLKKLKPDCIEDIIALVSLYRPGPMDNIPTYVARKHGKEKPDYPHPMIENILKETFGVIIYQEQVMQIAQVMGGYSLGQADLLRRAMGKKIKSEMDAQRDTFIEGAIKNKVSKAKATEVFELMAKFASYGFNKSHAAAYALIAFQTAYLKANYPVEFMAASMELDSGNTDKLAVFCQEARRMEIPLLPPDINASGANFTVEKTEDSTQAIRYALGALKNVGTAAMESLVKERTDNGPFKDVFDLAKRLDTKVINKRQLEYLIKAGALDSLEKNRKKLFDAIDILVAHSTASAEEKASNQTNLFAAEEADMVYTPELKDTPDWPFMERLQYEFEATGFYLMAHPLDSYDNLQKRLNVTYSANLEEKLSSTYEPIRLAGVVVSKKVKTSPKGRFAFVTLTDPAGIVEVSIFDEDLLSGNWDLLEAGNAVYLNAEGKLDDNGVRLIAQGISPLDDAIQKRGTHVEIAIEEGLNLEILQSRLGPPAQNKKKAAKVSLIVTVIDTETAVITLPNVYSVTPPLLTSLLDLPGVLEASEA